MTPEDLEKVRGKIGAGWRPDVRCADCLEPPTCPMLEDDVWRVAWAARPPVAERRCNCVEWSQGASRSTTAREVRTANGHWSRCDLTRASRRELLCLECVEERLERRVEIADLMPCMANYYVARVVQRAATISVHHGEVTVCGLDAAEVRWLRLRHDDLVRRVADAIVAHVERDQSSAEAETELRAAGVDVDRFMADLRRKLADREHVEATVTSPLDRLRALATPTPRDLAADPYRSPPECDHGVTFDADAATGLSADEIRRRWPRLDGSCPRGCGYSGIAYASKKHYVYGDW